MSKHAQKLKTLSSSALVELFAEAGIASGQALENAKSQLANKAYDLQERIFLELRSRGIEAQRTLLTLLNHPDRQVRCAAGTYALDFDPEAAVPVLEALERQHGFAAHNAGMALTQWRKGELQFT
jgi:hypothetical protein